MNLMCINCISICLDYLNYLQHLQQKIRLKIKSPITQEPIQSEKLMSAQKENTIKIQRQTGRA